MNSSAASCGLRRPCAQAPGKTLEFPLHVPVLPPWQNWLLPGQSLLVMHPSHVPPLHRS
jgi:hypothetical protein